jgi:2-phospho-L-lactate guanylyltransferase
VVVLVKDFATAKRRLGPAMAADERAELARTNAHRAIRAARAAVPGGVLVVAGSSEAARVAREEGAAVLLERRPAGQNTAARRGIDRALRDGAGAVLLLSSDLPLVTPAAVSRMLARGRRMPVPAALAAAAAGRGGTNALYLSPPDALGLHFGRDSMAQFRADARRRGVAFGVHRSRRLAIDLDEPADLAQVSS